MRIGQGVDVETSTPFDVLVPEVLDRTAGHNCQRCNSGSINDEKCQDGVRPAPERDARAEDVDVHGDDGSLGQGEYDDVDHFSDVNCLMSVFRIPGTTGRDVVAHIIEAP